MEEPSQELMFKLSMFEQQIRQLQQQLQAVEQGIVEMNTLSIGLADLVGKKGKEIFAPIGRGIFAKAKLESENLNVDIGGGNFVQKSIPETKKIIEKQIRQLGDVKKELENNLEKVSEEFNKVIVEAQKGEMGKKEHVHDENCEHDKSQGKKIDELV